MNKRARDGAESYRIVDTKALARVAAWLLEPGPEKKRWHERPAALRELRPTLSRLKNRRLKSLRATSWHAVLEQIEKRGGEHGNERFHEARCAVIADEHSDRHSAYIGWASSIGGGALQASAMVLEAGGLREVYGDEARRARYRSLIDALRRCRLTGRCAGAFAAFLERGRRAGFDDFRLNLALWRIVEPLVASLDSMLIERNVYELSEDELFAFVDAGIKRETILLKRDSSLARAQTISDRSEQLIAAQSADKAKARGEGLTSFGSWPSRWGAPRADAVRARQLDDGVRAQIAALLAPHKLVTRSKNSR